MRLIFLLVIPIIFSSCIYLPTQYYKLSGPGPYLRGACTSHDVYLVINQWDGLSIGVSLPLDENKKTEKIDLYSIRISFGVGEGHRLRFEDPTIEIISNSDHPNMKKHFSEFLFDITYDLEGDSNYKSTLESYIKDELTNEVRVHKRYEVKKFARVTYSIPPTEALHGASVTFSGWFLNLATAEWQKYRSYYTSIDVKGLDLEHFSIRFPKTFLDEQPIQTPTVKIDLVTQLEKFPLICN